MSWYEWRPYVPVAERRRQAERELKKRKKKGQSIAPVSIDGRVIAKSFWGKAWCENLERYSDYANRLPRGRTYVRNGSVVDLQIARGKVAAFVSGSDLYKIKIGIAPVPRSRWKAVCQDCAGSIDSLIELLQGRFAKGVMDRVCREGDGLFPAPAEITLSCSCPDWADMCKHVAAALYGVGARLDEKPELLFLLRGVDEKELLAGAGSDLTRARPAPTAQLLDESDVAALFGLEMAEPVAPATAAAAKQGARPGTAKIRKTLTTNGPQLATEKSAVEKRSQRRAVRTKTRSPSTTLAAAADKHARQRPRPSTP